MDIWTTLEGVGITGLHRSGKEIGGRCPMHERRTGRPDRRPSWYINVDKLTHFCHSCGYKGTLRMMLLDVTGEVPDDLEKMIAKEGFLRKWEEARRAPEETLERIVPTLTEFALRNIMGDVPQRLLDFRHLIRSAIDAYQVRWERATRRWVLPLRDPAGDLLGAQYRQKGSVLTLPEGLSKTGTLFGLAQASASNHCAVVESPLDAVRLAGIGVPAVSSLGAWVSKDQVTLLARNFTRVYVALDNDKAGIEAADQLCPRLRQAGTSVMRWDYTGLTDSSGGPAKDVGDVPCDTALFASWQRTLRFGL